MTDATVLEAPATPAAPAVTPTVAATPATPAAPATPATPATPAAAATPEAPPAFDWRKEIAGDDEKELKKLERFSDIKALHKALDDTQKALRDLKLDTHVVEFSPRLMAVQVDDSGARVVLTRTSDTGWGPCITERAAIANRAHADAAISIHADGGPATGRGYHVNYSSPPLNQVQAGPALHQRLDGEVRATGVGRHNRIPVQREE